MHDRDRDSLFDLNFGPLILPVAFVLMACLPAFAQEPSERSSPARHTLPSTSHKGVSLLPPEQILPPRFRGNQSPRPATVDHTRHSGVDSSVAPFVVPRRLQRPSSQPTPPSNGFAFRPGMLAGQIPTAVATADFNTDGKLDWAISNGLDNSIWIYLGKGDGTAGLPTILPTVGVGPTWMIATDLNGDGKTDLVVTEADSLKVGVFLGNGDGTFQPEVQYSVPAPPLFVVAGDFTGDGKLDVAVGLIGTTATGPVAVLPGDGKGHLGASLYTADVNASVGYWLTAVDLKGDGKLDLIVIDPDDFGPHGGAQIYLANTGTRKNRGQTGRSPFYRPSSTGLFSAL